MSNRILTKTYVAEGATPRRRIVRFGTGKGSVTLGAAATDDLVGVTDHTADTASGARVDVHRAGLVEVEAGAAFAKGKPLTTDGTGRAIAAAPAAGANVRIIGLSEAAAGAAGDVVDVMLAPSVMQG